MKKLLPLILMLGCSVHAQTSQTGRIAEGPVASLPTSCINGDTFISTDTGVFGTCLGNTWVFNAPSLNASPYVGGALAPYWGNGDIGAQINAAYASLPATGGTINIIPQSNGACYSFSTGIAYTTLGKYVLTVGRAGSNSVAQVNGGACLNWTPTSGSAITVDYVPSAGGGYTASHGFRDITLTNNVCETAGGCGSTAIGINIGPTNSGMQNGVIEDTKISGFGQGVLFGGFGGSWGVVFQNDSFSWNTSGLVINTSAGIENIHVTGGRFAANGRAFQVLGTGPVDMYIKGISCDSNTVLCFDGTVQGPFLSMEQIHFENLGGSSFPPNYVNTSGITIINSSNITDDTSTGTCPNGYWFKFTGAYAAMSDDTFFTGGRTCNAGSSAILDNAGVSYLKVLNQTPSSLTTVIGSSLTNNTLTNLSTQSGGTQPPNTFFGGIILGPGVGNPLSFNATLFAALVSAPNGTVLYCSDCTIANPCAGGGTGALAKRLNGVWVCN
jgi:hypothetical protein